MKKILFSCLFFMLVMLVGYAQSPEKFSYQAVVRDASGNLVINSPVGVRVSILKNSTSGVSMYCETHHLNTNTNGLLTMEIGGGTLVDGDFASIQWGDGSYFLKMETDVTGGSNYTISSTQQLLSVPYALYAKYAGNGGGGDTTGMASLLARLDMLEQQVQDIVTTINGGSGGNAGQPCPGMATVTDIDNNTYNTVQIGTQCWMKENLRTTRYSNGTSIALGSSTSTTTAYRYYPDNSSSNVPSYGYLYNWKAVMGSSSSSSANPSGVQGICPTGWHVPSDAEWTLLTDYVSSQTQYQCNGSSENVAKALASTTGWSSSSITCAVGNNTSSNNATGFSALPAGGYYGYYFTFGYYAGFWTATEYDGYNAYILGLGYDNANVNRYYIDKNYGFSVRCVRNESGSSTTELPTITTVVASNITETTAICGGNVTFDGGATVTARGVCWSTAHNPTISNSHTTNGSGTGSFTSNLTGLTANTTYYVRAYATNSQGTAYGNELSFTTTNSGTTQDGQPCLGAATVTDIDNNTYNTVQIGNQCWMKENLRTTRYSNGTSIALGSYISMSTAYRYYPNNNSSNVPTYGYLYNWEAVMDSTSSSSTNPSGVQGICPIGWHVPSDAEWTQLTNYVSSQSQYVCGDDNSYIAKALASTTGWNSSTNTCAVGNNPTTNNATGFSALPAGGYEGNYYSFGQVAYFWCATEANSGFAYGHVLSNGSAGEGRTSYFKYYAFPVRCVRD